MNTIAKFKKWIGNNVVKFRRQTHQGTGSRYDNIDWRSLSPNSDTRRYPQKITKDSHNLSEQEQTKLLKEQDWSISRVYNDGVIFPVLDYELTCENERGQQILDTFERELIWKRNPLPTILSKTFGSIITRGDYCFEITFDPSSAPANLFIVNTNTLRFRSAKDGNGNEYWQLGQYDEDNNFIALDSDRVFYDVINPLPDEFKGSSMIAPAFGPAIDSNQVSHDYVDVIGNQAYTRRYFVYNTQPMIDSEMKPEDINKEVENVRSMIKNTNYLSDPSIIPVIMGDGELKQVQGGNSGMRDAETLDRVHARHIMMGAGTLPFLMGSNEFTAESSAKWQALRDSIKTESLQRRVEKSFSSALTRALQASGITEPAELILKRVDIVERDFQADITHKMASSIRELVLSGMKLGTAVKFYEEMTDISIPEELIERIEQEYNVEPTDERTDNRSDDPQPTNSNDV